MMSEHEPVGAHGAGVLHKAQYRRPWSNIPKSPITDHSLGGLRKVYTAGVSNTRPTNSFYMDPINFHIIAVK